MTCSSSRKTQLPSWFQPPTATQLQRQAQQSCPSWGAEPHGPTAPSSPGTGCLTLLCCPQLCQSCSHLALTCFSASELPTPNTSADAETPEQGAPQPSASTSPALLPHSESLFPPFISPVVTAGSFSHVANPFTRLSTLPSLLAQETSLLGTAAPHLCRRAQPRANLLILFLSSVLLQ